MALKLIVTTLILLYTPDVELLSTSDHSAPEV